MSGRVLRSAAAALRVSLISGCGALGLLALSAGAATADDGAQSLLGSVTPVVESVTAPVQPVVESVTAPVASTVEAVTAPVQPVVQSVTVPVASTVEAVAPLPETSNLISSVPQLVGELSVTGTVAPITTAVDAVIAQVPVVSDVLPQGTTTAITEPLLKTVDGAVSPVLAPAQQILEPVSGVLDPIVTPVVDAVVPVLTPVVEAVDPVIGVVEPVLPVAVPARSGDSLPTTDEVGQVLPGDRTVVASVPASSREALELPEASVAVGLTDGSSVEAEALASSSFQGVQSPGVYSQSVHLQDLRYGAQAQAAPQPGLSDPQPWAGSFALPAASAGALLTGSSSSGGFGVADVPSFFTFNLSSAIVLTSGDSADLPQGPAFDPGSTPD